MTDCMALVRNRILASCTVQVFAADGLYRRHGRNGGAALPVPACPAHYRIDLGRRKCLHGMTWYGLRKKVGTM
jgi:hypothetical protein